MNERDAFGQPGTVPARSGAADDERLARELVPGERMLWSGRPENRRWLYPEDLVLVPFSILWGGFAIFWEVGALTSSAQGGAGTKLLFSLWGVPFVLIGLYLIAGRLFARRWILARSLYVLTDRRVLSFSPSLTGRSSVKMIWLNSYPPLEQRVARGGFGTLWVGALAMGQQWLGASGGWPGPSRATGSAIALADIPDVTAVYALVAQQITATGTTEDSHHVRST